jgi:hypothetical protein
MISPQTPSPGFPWCGPEFLEFFVGQVEGHEPFGQPGTKPIAQRADVENLVGIDAHPDQSLEVIANVGNQCPPEFRFQIIKQAIVDHN